jgi:3D (Asp-Asp-Asp) domain-containing protein
LLVVLGTTASAYGATGQNTSESQISSESDSFAEPLNPLQETQSALTALMPGSIQDNSIMAVDAPPSTTASNKTPQKKSGQTRYVVATAYSSTSDQTDSSPFITANGSHVYDGLVAANFLPFHTKIKIPQVFGDKVFTVEDRMNSRYSNRIDVWFPNRELAYNFGIQKVKIEIVSQ